MDSYENAMLMLEAEKDFVKDFTEAQRYKYFLGSMQYIKYSLGHESIFSTDCSGSVCLALLLATGCSIRVTADELFRKYFTIPGPGENDIGAAFFFKEDSKNKCAHVAGICGKDVVLNCVEPYSRLRSLSDMAFYYNLNDYKVVLRGLDRRALELASSLGKDLNGAGRMFTDLIMEASYD